MGIVSVKYSDDNALLIHHRDEGSDLPVIHQIWSARAYDPNRLRRWPDLQLQLARMTADGKRPLIIDAGANIGASSLFFATFFEHAYVIAVEPEQTNFALLAQNARQSSSIACVNGALSCRAGTLGIVDPGLGDVGYRAVGIDAGDPDEGRWTGATITGFSVHQLLAMAPDDAVPFIVKIDIEGGESDVFARNTSWIDLFPLLIVELHDWMLPGTANSKNFLCSIAAAGRDFVQIGENTFSIRN